MAKLTVYVFGFHLRFFFLTGGPLKYIKKIVENVIVFGAFFHLGFGYTYRRLNGRHFNLGTGSEQAHTHTHTCTISTSSIIKANRFYGY